MEEKICTNCGYKNNMSANFCKSCGNSLSEIEKTPEEKAEEVKQRLKEKANNAKQSSKDSISTFFILIKPILKLKIVIPLFIILVALVYSGDIKQAYNDYKYEQKQIEKKKRDIEKKLSYQENIFTKINQNFLGIKIGDSAISALEKLERIGTRNDLYSYDYDIKYGFGKMSRKYTFWKESYDANSIDVRFDNCIVSRILITQRLPGSQYDIKNFLNSELENNQNNESSTLYDNRITIQKFNSRHPRNGVYIRLGFKDSYMQKLFKSEKKYTCKELGR